jgi:hypothetical protein
MSRVLLVLVLWGSALSAQDAPRRAALAGTVRDTAGMPLSNATISVRGHDLTAVSDSAGRFHLSGPIAGRPEFTVLRLGYAAITFEATLPPDSTIVVELRLKRAQTLAGVNVESQREAAGLARAGFYDRQKSGRGQFLTPEQVAKLDMVTQTSGMLRDLRGMRVICRRAVGPCEVTGTAGACMSLFMDGVYTRDPVGRGMALDERVSPNIVHAIEVYNTAGAVPMHFTRPVTEGRCGAIVVWTSLRRR